MYALNANILSLIAIRMPLISVYRLILVKPKSWERNTTFWKHIFSELADVPCTWLDACRIFMTKRIEWNCRCYNCGWLNVKMLGFPYKCPTCKSVLSYRDTSYDYNNVLKKI